MSKRKGGEEKKDENPKSAKEANVEISEKEVRKLVWPIIKELLEEAGLDEDDDEEIFTNYKARKDR